MPYTPYYVGETAVFLHDSEGSKPNVARVVEAYSDDTYDVVLTGFNRLIEGIPSSLLRHTYTPRPSQLGLGTRVLARDQNRWDPGTIARVHDEELFDVWYDEGNYYAQKISSESLILFMERTPIASN